MSEVETVSGLAQLERIIDLERDRIPAVALALDPLSDFWFDAILTNRAGGSASAEIDLATDLADEGTLTVEGYVNELPSDGATVALSVGGSVVMEQPVRLTGFVSFTFSELSAIPEEANVELAISGNGPATLFLDGVTTRSSHLGIFDTAVIDTRGGTHSLDSGVTQVLRIEGATATLVPSENGAVVLGDGRYVFVQTPHEASDLRPAPTATWDQSDLEVDFLIVVPDGLGELVTPLAEARRAEGLRTSVVTLSEVYAVASADLKTPVAIAAFLQMAHEQWRVAPRYVLLAGAGTLDPGNRLGVGGDLVPTWMKSAPTGLYASDSFFSDLDSDSVPDLAVGRLPARNADELETMIGALVLEAPKDLTDVTLVADGAREASLFASQLSRMQAELARAAVDSQIIGGTGDADADRAALQGVLGTDPNWVHYVGHGGMDRLSDDALLTTADVTATELRSTGLWTAATCNISRFEVPGFAPLGVELMLGEQPQAFAVWAPSTVVDAVEAETRTRAMARSLSRDYGRLGDAILSASRASDPSPDTPLDAFNLLGDPTQRPFASASTLPEDPPGSEGVDETEDPTVVSGTVRNEVVGGLLDLIDEPGIGGEPPTVETPGSGCGGCASMHRAELPWIWFLGLIPFLIWRRRKSVR